MRTDRTFRALALTAVLLHGLPHVAPLVVAHADSPPDAVVAKDERKLTPALAMPDARPTAAAAPPPSHSAMRVTECEPR